MSRLMRWLPFALTLPLVLLGAERPPTARAVDPDSADEREAVALLAEYLRVDTTNPPGNEHRAAEFLKSVFDREGIPSEIFDQGNNRSNVLARLPGSGLKRPILLLNHLDVVPAEAARWTVPPFSGATRDGYLWGRGATDMKGTAICHLMTMLILKRRGVPLERDVLFLGTADEEEGKENGVDWMISRHKDRFGSAEFVLTEGATISLENGKTTAWNVDVTEKSVLWLRVVTSGKAGHGSIPEPEGAVARLVRALGRILDYEPPVRLIPAVEGYFRELSKTAPAELKPALADPRAALADPARRKLLLSDPYRNACLRPTISVTGLSAGAKINVIPGEASATIDCRLLPGEDPGKFVETLKGIVKDPTLRFEVLNAGRATASPTDTELFSAIRRARDRLEPGVPILTPPLTSSTDAGSLRQVGMVVYGFEPFHLSDDDDRSHGDDERLSLANVAFGLKVTYAVVTDLAARKSD
ncbi:MAG TPA: M20/M25/M40 family metallo-hydrolase [Thermoanaerobaculia bacterium]|nr:M20/M25/M40 family metallo-hydrolase [Thermoanaerobaculia bacterium]